MVKAEAPDQARSWAIALAACVINTMLSGISRTTGLIYVALIETYGVSRFQANLPFTMRNIVRNLSGPIVGAIGQRYGAREVTIAGGVFASLGIILCTFVSDITWITVLWGGMHGFGVALGNTLFQVIVTQYFLKYRATACGLAISGACIGSFVFPAVIEYTLAENGLTGTFLITGGLMMHVLPASLLMKEPPWIRRKTKTLSKQESSTVNPYPAAKQQTIISTNTMGVIQEESNGVSFENKAGSVVHVRKISATSNSSSEQSRDGSTYNNGKSRNDGGIDNAAFVGSKLNLTMDAARKKSPDELTVDKLDIFESKGTEQVPDVVEWRSRLRTISIGEVSMTLPFQTPEILQETSLYRGIIKVCRDPMFHMISFSLAAFAMLFDPAITVIVDYIMDKGMKEDVAKYFISMLALGDLFGRLCFGWVTDKDYLSIPKFMMLLQVIQGICFLLMPLFYSFNMLMAIMVIFGLTSGASLVMFPILVGKYLQSVQSLAIGSIQFFSGILSFAVPPIIGYFRDKVGSYDGMFYITGGLSVVAGFFWLLEPFLMKLRTKLEKGENSGQTIVCP